jgi:hypothetical protein
MHRGPGAAEGDNERRVKNCVNTGIVTGSIKEVTNHSGQGDLKGKLNMSGISEGVCDKKGFLCAGSRFFLPIFFRRRNQILERAFGFRQRKRG